MSIYKHLTLDERFRLASLIKEDFECNEIAERLGRNPGTISREIDRNSKADGIYEARYAHKKAKLRRQNSKRGSRKIENDTVLVKKLEERLDRLTSPEIVVQEKDINVCFATVYSWIYRSRNDLRLVLPYQGKKRRKYGTKRGKKIGWTRLVKDIDIRPREIENRSTLYHYEGDTVHGVNGRLLTYTDRKSRFEVALLIPDGTANEVYEKTRDSLTKYPINTITYDRGSEFALWKMIEKATKSQAYFAKPHHPWQRGSNENANGRIRRIYPKKFNFATITQKDVNAVTWKMNHTKRKCLNWHTPCEVFKACCTSS